MEVPTTHCFSINGGYIVHNCRYGTEKFWHNGMYGGNVADLHGIDALALLGL